MTTLGILYDVRQCQNKFTIMLIVEKSINSLNIINTTKYLNGNKHAILSAVYYEYISLCSQYISKIRCHRECTSESLFGMLFTIVYFGTFKFSCIV